MAEPASELNEWLAQMEKWAKKTFHTSGTRKGKIAPAQVSFPAKREFEGTLKFIRQLHDDATLEDVESASIQASADRVFAVQSFTPTSYRAAADAMLTLLLSFHPELSEQVKQLRSNQRR